jgi:hypothetical protein
VFVQTKLVYMGANWRARIGDYIAPHRLPVHWGGTMLDAFEDPMCRSMWGVDRFGARRGKDNSNVSTVFTERMSSRHFRKFLIHYRGALDRASQTCAI